MEIIKCPNYHKGGVLNKRSCYNSHPFYDMGAQQYSCRIKKGNPPCDKGFIDKKEYEKLAYPISNLQKRAFKKL